MNILITGATGFIGSHVLQKLKQTDHEVTVLSSRSEDGFRVIDAQDYHFSPEYLFQNGCEEIDTILHIGAFTPKKASEASDSVRCTSNIMGTEALLLSKLPSLERFVFLSTLDVYGSPECVITESTSCAPLTLYGFSKYYCEKMIQSHFSNTSVIHPILRIGHVYGEGEEVYQKVMPAMIRQALSGEDLNIYGSGEAHRTFIYVQDVADAILASLKLTDSPVINVVGSESFSVNQLAKLIHTICGSHSQIRHVLSEVPEHDLLFDNTRLRQLLLPALTPFTEGLTKEITYMKNKTDMQKTSANAERLTSC